MAVVAGVGMGVPVQTAQLLHDLNAFRFGFVHQWGVNLDGVFHA